MTCLDKMAEMFFNAYDDKFHKMSFKEGDEANECFKKILELLTDAQKDLLYEYDFKCLDYQIAYVKHAMKFMLMLQEPLDSWEEE